MPKFYTSVAQAGNKILLRGYEDGKRIQREVPYKPYMFVPTREPSKYKTLDGKTVGRVDFDSIKEAREFIKQYQGVDGFKIFGLEKFPYTFIFDEYLRKGDIEYDPSLVSVVSIDIEVSIAGGQGFPDIQAANNPITLITISRNGYKSVFGCGDYKVHMDNVKYYKCKDEEALLRVFLEIWNSSDYSPDVVTGWNVDFFDIPYIVNRISKVLGDKEARKLSPWNFLQEKKIEIFGKETQIYVPVGITILDYRQLYKKFGYTQQETYKLDHIAQEELGEKKLEFEGSLGELEVNDWQKYTEYNIHDVVLVDKLDDKLKLIELVMAMAYDAGVNYQDTFTTVGLWDVIIHHYLMRSNTVVHQFEKASADRDEPILGGYVKTPVPGMYKWVISLDLNSLYPHIIMQYNISPETFMGWLPDDGESLNKEFTESRVLRMFNGYMNDKQEWLRENNYTVTANMCVFSREKQGFLPAIMEKMYNDRTVYKKKMIEAKQKIEVTEKGSPEYIQLVKDAARFDNLQMSKKIQLNSGYGALANVWNRWFRREFAEGITSSGQLSTRWIERKLNQYLNKLLKTTDFDYVIACDTDSVYLNAEKLAELSGLTDTQELVKWFDNMAQKALEPYIDKCYEELGQYMNAFQQKMRMKRECIADKGIWTAKKHYILNVYNQEGVAYEKPKLKMMGIEAIRTSTPAVVRQGIKDALGIIMNKTEPDLQQYIAKFRDEFVQMPFDRVAFPRSVKNMAQYTDRSNIYTKGTPINVKGSLIFNHLLKEKKLEERYERIADGQKIKFAYLKTPNPVRANVIACTDKLPTELGLDKYIDHGLQFDKSFIEPIKTIINTIGWEIEKKATLDGWIDWGD